MKWFNFTVHTRRLHYIYLGGTVANIILVWLLVLMKSMIYCRAFAELFLPTSLALPQNIKTSLFDKLMVSLFGEFTNTTFPAPGFTSPWTLKLFLISVLTFAAQFLAWLSSIIRTFVPSHLKPYYWTYWLLIHYHTNTLWYLSCK